jgi:hypothetical protein
VTRRRLCVVICGNGLGHCKRALHVLGRIVRRRSVETDVYVQDWQLRAARGWRAIAWLLDEQSVRFRKLEAGRPMSTQPPGTDSASYLGWIDCLRREQAIMGADVVVSDNLAGVLAARPDAVLMGSFLWHDVLGGTGRIAEDIADFEEELLQRARPPMLCVDDVVLPAVERLTEAVRLPWFCDAAGERRPRSGPVRRVLLMGGATDAVAPALRELAGVLLEQTELLVSLPARLLDDRASADARLQPFGFGENEYDEHDLVVGRPGVGTLTDCVRFGLPILCFGDEDDAEMRHNAERVEALGLGRRISLHEPEATARLLREELSAAEYASWSASAAARPCGGIAAAARFVEELLENRR